MVETGYFGNMKNYPETDILICVSRKYPWFIKKDKMEHYIELSPSSKLLSDWKEETISGHMYSWRFKKQMKNMVPKNTIELINDEEKWGLDKKTYRLMCWEKNPPCHRFILKELIEETK